MYSIYRFPVHSQKKPNQKQPTKTQKTNGSGTELKAAVHQALHKQVHSV